MKQLIALCLFAILFASCSNSTDNSSQTHDDLMPLKVGNYWIYENKDYSLKNQDSLVSQFLDTTLVEASLQVDSKTIFKLKNDFYYCSQSDGMWVYFINGNVVMEKSLMFKFPSKVGEIVNFNPINLQVKTISTNESVKIDLGSYVCYKYHLTNAYNNSFVYYAPNIGLIKNHGIYYSDELKDSVISYRTLISYHLE